MNFVVSLFKVYIKKNYQLFETPEQVMRWLKDVDSSEFDLQNAKSWDVNKELVSRYEERSKRNS